MLAYPQLTDPLPLPLGDNTAYALPLAEGGAILVDAGPDIPGFEGSPGAEGGTWELLVALLAAGGIATSDVRAVLVTHQHLDHAGLAARWAAEGARILAGAADVPALAGGQAWGDARRGARIAALIEHGVPPELVERMSSPTRRRPPEYRWAPCPRDAIEAVADGAEFALAGGASLRAIHAPGHTPGNLVAFVEASGDLYSGDTLLPGTVPTPGLHFADADADTPPTAAARARACRRCPTSSRRWRGCARSTCVGCCRATARRSKARRPSGSSSASSATTSAARRACARCSRSSPTRRSGSSGGCSRTSPRRASRRR